VNYSFRDITFSKEEFIELKTVVGEFKRICHDQVYRYVKGSYEQSGDAVSQKRLEIAESILSKLNTAEYLNKTVK
jgi:hypothetical protein